MAGIEIKPFEIRADNVLPTDVLLWDTQPLTLVHFEIGNFYRATIPAELVTAGNHVVRIQTPTGALSPPWDFLVVGPVITAVNAGGTRTAGGNAFTLQVTGNNFTNTQTVRWDGVPLSTQYISVNQLNASVPVPLIAGTHVITVTQGAAASNNNFTVTVVPAPVLQILDPSTRSQTTVPIPLTITGLNFQPGMSILWDATPLTPVGEPSANSRTVTIPANVLSPGTHTVTARTADGANSNGLTFTITPARVLTSISPNRRTATNGPVTLLLIDTGNRFLNGDVAMWDNTPLQTQFNSAGQLQADLPSNLLTAGTHQVGARTIDFALSNTLPFTVDPAPVITSLNPTNRTEKTAQFTLTVNGNNFISGMEVRWDGTALPTAFGSSNVLSATVAPSLLVAGPHNITVRTAPPELPALNSNPVVFTVDPAPALISLDQNSRTAGNGPFTLTLTGTSFPAGVQARFDNTGLETTRLSPTTLRAVVPPGVLVAGAHTILVRTTDGFDTNTLPFTVGNLQVLSSLSPNSRVATASGFSMTLRGANFVAGMIVHWQNGGAETDLATQFINDTTLTATVPAALLVSPGSANVTVRSADLANSGAQLFQILPVPVIASLNPASVLAGSPLFGLGVNGANFVPGSVITYDGVQIGTTLVAPNQMAGTVQAFQVAVPGTHNIAVLTPDGVSSGPFVFSVVQSLQILTTTLPNGRVGAPYIAGVVGQGGKLPYSWAISGLPAGLGHVIETGVISGVPAAAGSTFVTVRLTDAAGQTTVANILLTIDPSTGPLTFPATSLPQGIVGENYSAALFVTGGRPAYSFSIAGGVLPFGLSLSADGFITGKPTTVGNYGFSVRVSDANNSAVSQSLSIEVIAPPLSITTASPLPDGSVGGSVNIPFAAAGGVPPYSFSASGSFPPGLQFGNGILTGTANSAGTYGFRVTVTDSNGTTAAKDFSITIGSPGLTITTSSFPNGQLNGNYSAQLGASGGKAPYTWAASGMPDGVTVNSSGTMSGTPGIAGKFPISVTVTDSDGKTATKTIELTVDGDKLTVIGTLANGTVGASYDGSVSASGGAKPYLFSFSGLPGGLGGGIDGKVGGVPDAAGSFPVTATVTDAKGATASSTFFMTVAAKPIVVITVSVPNPQVGTTYNTKLTASGGTGPLTFSATGLPPGFTLSPDGTLSGTPTGPVSQVVNVTVTDQTGVSVSTTVTITIALPAAPPVVITGLELTLTPGAQPRARASINAPYPLDITVTLTMDVAADVPPDDPAAQFSTGGRTAVVTIPAGSTQSSTDVGLQAGTTAATITIVARSTAGGQDITSNPPPTTVVRVNAAPPAMSGVTATRSGNTLTVTVSGIVSTKQVTSATFAFNAAPGANLQTSTVTVPVETLFRTWFQSAQAAGFGGQFTFTQTFTISGDPGAVQSVGITLISQNGTSSPMTANVQ